MLGQKLRCSTCTLLFNLVRDIVKAKVPTLAPPLELLK